MDNKTQSFQFRKTKLALAVAMTVSLAACGVDGDEGSVSTSNSTADASQPNQVNVSEPKGTVQGVVLDTNGMPVAGASITIGSLTTTTDASGSYSVADVKVTNVAGADANTGHNPIVVVIQAPDAGMYASTATVVVNPQAQVDASNNVTNSSAIPLTTFVDGFTAQAATAIMPKKMSVVEGWLRNHATGEAIANQEVSLDFTGLSTTVIAGANIGNFTLSGDSFKATTDASGYFRFEHVYDDSSFNLSTSDYTFASTGTIPSQDIDVVESVTIGGAASGTIATSNAVKSINSVLVDGINRTSEFTVVNGVITANQGTNPYLTANNVVEYVTLGGSNVSSIPVTQYASNLDSIAVQGATDTQGGTNATWTGFVASGGNIIATNGVDLANSANDRLRVQYDAMVPVLPSNANVIVSYEYATGTSSTTNNGSQTTTVNGVTTSEGVENNVGTLTVNPITSGDNVAPYVSNVTGWIKSSAGGYGILNEGVNKTFTVHFSEPVNKGNFNIADMLVTNSSSSILALEAENGIVLADDGRSVTVNLAEAQDPGTKISIFMPWQDTTDVAGNFFSVVANDDMDIDFDSRVNASSGKASFLRVNLCVFLPAVINPTGFAAVQDFNWSSSVDADSADLASYSNAFWDNHDGGTDSEIRQLNGQADTAVFLKQLADVVGAGTYSVDNNHAWVDVTLGEASGFTYTGGSGTSTASHVWFDGVGHGSKKTFTFLNDLSLAAGSVTVTLVDGVKPTTTLQENYTLPGSANYASRIVTTGAVPTLGAGGEVTEVGEAATIGNPIIYIQPRHLTPTGSNNIAIRGEEFDNLTDSMPGRGTSATPSSVQDSAAGVNPAFTGMAQPIYDDAAFAAWTAADRANSLGIAFVENVALVAGSTPIFSGDDATLSGYSVLNNVDKNIDNADHVTGLAQDLVRVQVSDMLALANDDNNTTIAFSGDIQDSYGNVADDNSRATVVLRDAMPPMVVSAAYNGADVTIEYNEALGSRAALHNAVITIDDFVSGAAEQPVSITLNSSSTGSTAGAFSLSADSKTLTVQLGTNSAAVSDLFDNATAAFQWNEVGSSAAENHASLAWDTVPDARGNEWASFDSDTVGAAGTRDNRYEVEAPRFYIYDNVGPFTYSVATAGYDDGGAGGDDDGNVVYTITFTHPIDLTSGNAFYAAIDANDGAVTPDPITNLSYSTANATGAAVLNALFNMDINGDGNPDANDSFNTGVVSATVTNGSMSISGGNTIVTLTVSAAAESIIHGTSTFGFATTTTSAINGDLTTAGNFNWQNTN